MRHVAVIGAGPSGLYLVDQLLRAAPDVEVDILERLPTPLGLIRYGVAPDHQATKAVARILDRILSRERVRYFGNVTVGSDVSLDFLLEHYDAVVLATGSSVDRRLGIAGENLAGVYGSGAFVGWYNSHPDKTDMALSGARHAVIVGAGNVAIDVARLLAKRGSELLGSDLSPEVEAALAEQPLERITIVARGSAANARFTQLELAELEHIGAMKTAVFDPDGIEGDSAVSDTLRSLAKSAKETAPISLDIRFRLTPIAVLGEQRATALRVVDRDGDQHDLPADLIVTCIGYQAADVSSQTVTAGVFENQSGRVRERLYAVGWCKRGPSGTIPTNRTEATQVAQLLVEETVAGDRQGTRALADLFAATGVRAVDYVQWRRIDEDEVGRAGEGRVRRKHTAVDDMLAAAFKP